MNEHFVSTEKSVTLTKNIFIGIAIMFLSLIIGGIFAWSYMNGVFTFITTLLFIVMIYSIINLMFVLINKSKLSETTYNIQLGSSIYMICVTFLMMLYFGSKSYGGSRGSSYTNPGYNQGYSRQGVY